MDFGKKIKNWFGGLFDKDRLNFAYSPWGDWRIIVIVFLLGEVLIISSHYFFYQWSAVAEDQSSSQDGSQTIVEQKNKLDQVYFLYQNKQKVLEDAQKNPPSLVDPSL
ncbi:MAG: hypothetical protein WCW56_01155 [Candidatus Paceibacterota bacterium]|jgi:hypothetical protein